MAQKIINVGTDANYGDGEPLRSAFIKVNENFTEVYAEILEGRDSNVVGSDSTILVDAENNKINLDGTVKGDIIPDTNVAYDIGSATKRFKDLYLSGNTINLGGTAISVESGELKLGGVKIPSQTDLDTSIADVTAGKFSFNITGDDSTVRTVQSGSNISIKGGANITTASDVDGNITITGPDLSSYLTAETSHADVVVDGDFTSSGFMKTDGAGNYSVDSATYLSAITLGQVTGVDITNPSDNQVLSYDAGNGEWRNANPSGGSSINGITDNTTGSPVLTLADNLITLSPGVVFSLGDDLDLNNNDITGSGNISVSGQARFARSGSPYVAINEENGKVYSWYGEFTTEIDARMVKVGDRGQRMNGSSSDWRPDGKTGIIMSDNTYLGSSAGFTFLVGRKLIGGPANSTSGTTITINKAIIESSYSGRLVSCLDQLVAKSTAGWEVRNRDTGNSINATVTSATTDGTDYTINLDTDVGTSENRELEFFCAWDDFGGGGGITDLVSDTTPQLGGNLDLNSNNITGTGNINITGTLALGGNNISSVGDIAAGTLNNHTIPGGSAGTLALTSDIPAGGGATDLSGLTDVIITNPVFRQVLMYDTGSWYNTTYRLNDISNVNANNPTNGEVLTYSSSASQWIPQSPAGGSTTSNSVNISVSNSGGSTPSGGVGISAAETVGVGNGTDIWTVSGATGTVTLTDDLQTNLLDLDVTTSENKRAKLDYGLVSMTFGRGREGKLLMCTNRNVTYTITIDYQNFLNATYKTVVVAPQGSATFMVGYGMWTLIAND